MQKSSRLKSSSSLADEIFLQPWFLDRRRAEAIRRMVPDHFVHKMRFYFEDWGCLVCDSKRRRYGSNGMCHVCTHRIQKRLFECLKGRHVRTEKAPPSTRLMDEIARVRSARMLLSDLVDGAWSPSPLRLSSSVRRTRSKGSPGFVR